MKVKRLKRECIFVGCDPGRKGGIAVISAGGKPLLAERIPQCEVPMRGKPKKRKDGKPRKPRMQVDVWELKSLVKRIAALKGRKVAALERVWARPHEGVTSSFTFGSAFGSLQQVLADYNIPFILVLPSEWQSPFAEELKGLKPIERKKVYLRKAREQFVGLDLSKEGDDDVAAALLLADYYRQLF